MTHLTVPSPAQFRKLVRPLGPTLDPVHQDYLQGLIASERKSARSIARTTQTRWHYSTLTRHLDAGTRAPAQVRAYLPPLVRTPRCAVRHPDGFLVVDYTAIEHEGVTMEAVDRVWDSARKQVIWGHKPLVVGYAPPQGFVPVVADFWLPPWACEPQTSYRTETELALSLIDLALEQGLRPRGVVFDAGLFSLGFVRDLRYRGLAWAGRCRGCQRVVVQGRRQRVDALATHLPEASWRYYPKWACYAKKLAAVWPGYGRVQVLLTRQRQWDPDTGAPYWYYTFLLVSDRQWGVERCLSLYARRARIEGFYRTSKQELGLDVCRCRALGKQLHHVYLVLLAFVVVSLVQRPDATFGQAREFLAVGLRRPLPTGSHPLLPLTHPVWNDTG